MSEATVEVVIAYSPIKGDVGTIKSLPKAEAKELIRTGRARVATDEDRAELAPKEPAADLPAGTVLKVDAAGAITDVVPPVDQAAADAVPVEPPAEEAKPKGFKRRAAEPADTATAAAPAEPDAA